MRRVAASILRDQGYRVIEAEDGEKALEHVTQNSQDKIDLLVTDVVLPKMNGKQLADSVRRVKPLLPTLFISGYTKDILDGLREVHFLQKPFEPAALSFKVREILDLD